MDNYNILNLMQSVTSDIENLQEYFSYQSKTLTTHIFEEVPKYKYGLTLDNYFFNIVLGNEFFSLSEKEKKTIEDIVESCYSEVKDGKTILQYKLKNIDHLKTKYELNPSVARMKFFNLLVEQPKILNESTLIMILIKFENAIAGIFRFLIEKYPEAYLQDKSITYSKLFSIAPDIAYIKEHFVNKEVETIMRASLDDWYKLFRDKHNVNFSFLGKAFEGFREIYYRRNLIVHNNGQVNEIYLSKIQTNDSQNGMPLITDIGYVKRTFTTTLMILYGTFWALIKVINKDNKAILEFMFQKGCSYMMTEWWSLSKFIFSLLKDIDSPKLIKMYARFNYWISIKNSEGIEKIKKEIIKFDVSDMKNEFLVAKFALLDDFKKVSEILNKIIGVEMPVQNILEWPLFIQYRKSDEYKKFVNDHSDMFKINEYVPSDKTIEEEKEIISRLKHNANIDDFLKLLGK